MQDVQYISNITKRSQKWLLGSEEESFNLLDSRDKFSRCQKLTNLILQNVSIKMSGVLLKCQTANRCAACRMQMPACVLLRIPCACSNREWISAVQSMFSPSEPHCAPSPHTLTSFDSSGIQSLISGRVCFMQKLQHKKPKLRVFITLVLMHNSVDINMKWGGQTKLYPTRSKSLALTPIMNI